MGMARFGSSVPRLRHAETQCTKPREVVKYLMHRPLQLEVCGGTKRLMMAQTCKRRLLQTQLRQASKEAEAGPRTCESQVD